MKVSCSVANEARRPYGRARPPRGGRVRETLGGSKTALEKRGMWRFEFESASFLPLLPEEPDQPRGLRFRADVVADSNLE
jgi:hypothetical protein